MKIVPSKQIANSLVSKIYSYASALEGNDKISQAEVRHINRIRELFSLQPARTTSSKKEI